MAESVTIDTSVATLIELAERADAAAIERMRFLCDIYAHGETSLTAAQVVAAMIQTLERRHG